MRDTTSHGNKFIVNDGQLLTIDNIKPADINIETIANSLSNQCRFNGHTDSFYSVAQHSCLAYDNASKEMALPALLHDSAEAYTGDIVQPVKCMFTLLDKIEHDILCAILQHLSVPNLIAACESDAMKDIDMRMLATEKRDLFKLTGDDWPTLKGVEPYSESIEPWTPQEAKKQWLIRLNMKY